MTLELNKEYKITRSKEVLFRVSAIVLFIGAILSIPVSIMFRSILPLSGISLVIEAYALLIMASNTMLINSEGILLKSLRGERFLPWINLGEIAQDKSINRHKVSYTLLSNPHSTGINLGFCRFKISEGYHLPGTFGMKAKELAADLEKTRRDKIEHKLK